MRPRAAFVAFEIMDDRDRILAIETARRAGALLHAEAGKRRQITFKGSPTNLVTEMDHRAEALILEAIRAECPGDAILSEERGTVGGPSSRRWIIDPLDGTTNFLHGVPQYAVSIALVHHGVLAQAVVYDPSRNDLFTASRGRGAFLNDRRMRVSKTDHLRDALISTGFPFRDLAHLDNYIAMFRAVTEKSSGVRRPGAASLDLAWVACGRFDGFWEIGLSSWDVAAGALLIQEAGGLITGIDGGENFLATGNVVCGNPKVFGQLLQAVSAYAPKAKREHAI